MALSRTLLRQAARYSIYRRLTARLRLVGLALLTCLGFATMRADGSVPCSTTRLKRTIRGNALAAVASSIGRI